MWLALKRMLILVDTFGRHRPMMIKKINRRIMTKSVKERRRRRILAKTCNLARVRTAFSRQRLQRGLDFIRINEICLVYIWELSTSGRLACALALVSLFCLCVLSPGCSGPDFSGPSDHGKSAAHAWRSSDAQEQPRSPRDWPTLCPGLWPLAPVPPLPQRFRGHCRRQTRRWGGYPTSC